MKYDFTTILERHNKDAIAIDGVGRAPGFAPDAPKDGFDIIPMWIADMNFPVVPSVQEALRKRIDHPAFGYFRPWIPYYSAISNWQREHNGVEGITSQEIGYENGVLGGLVSALSVFCSKGDAVLVHSPTYVGFTHTLTNNGYHIVHSPLQKDASGIWRMDLANMEALIKEHHIHAAIFCSPHNPTGRVWTRDEIKAAMDLFKKYDVYVISDEIWSDLLLDGHQHVPTQSVSEDARQRTVALYAPSKTFNLAGLIGSYHIIYNSWIRDRVDKESSLCHYNDMNVLSMHALLGAYSQEGKEWVRELQSVLSKNAHTLYDYLRKEVPLIDVSLPEGTYMLFLDCRAYCEHYGLSLDRLLKRAWDVGVAWQDGRQFHHPCAIRVNTALPLTRLEEAIQRMREYVFIDK